MVLHTSGKGQPSPGSASAMQSDASRWLSSRRAIALPTPPCVKLWSRSKSTATAAFCSELTTPRPLGSPITVPRVSAATRYPLREPRAFRSTPLDPVNEFKSMYKSRAAQQVSPTASPPLFGGGARVTWESGTTVTGMVPVPSPACSNLTFIRAASRRSGPKTVPRQPA